MRVSRYIGKYSTRSDDKDKTTNIIRGKLREGPGCGSARRVRGGAAESLEEDPG